MIARCDWSSPRLRHDARISCAPPGSRSRRSRSTWMKRSGEAKRRTRTCGGWQWRRRREPGTCSIPITVRLKPDTTYEPVRLKDGNRDVPAEWSGRGHRRGYRRGGRRRHSRQASRRRGRGADDSALVGAPPRGDDRRQHPAARGIERGCVETTAVECLAMTDADVAWYVASGEGRDKAGAYAIQGLASRFMPRIEGSYANVVGLPVARRIRVIAAICIVDGLFSYVNLSRKSL